jgi:hypothetical protein
MENAMRKVAMLLLSLVFLASPAAADDGADEKSPAAESFREGYWQETGAGALDRALEHYAKALAAEGSAAVKARTLYRTAVVLQRMGRTTEAVRTLERLAKEFPDATGVLADAKRRLDEWSAVDLRTSFEDWYRRYQFTPEFQAKVLDLIRALGSRDGATANGAQRELLTIGAPALPALRMHLGTENVVLRRRVVVVLLLLGEVPPAGPLVDSSEWTNDGDAWKNLMKAAPEVRAARRQELASMPGPQAAAARAALGGRDAMIEALAREDLGRYAWHVVQAVVAAPWEPALVDRLEAVMLDPKTPESAAKALFQSLLIGATVPPARVLSWVPRVPAHLLQDLYKFLAERDRGYPPEAWRDLAAFLIEKPGEPHNLYGVQALLRVLEAAPEGVDVSPAGDAVMRQGFRSWPSATPRNVDVAFDVARRAEDEQVAGAAWSALTNYQRPGTFDRYVTLAEGAALPAVRRAAVQQVGRTTDAKSMDGTFALLARLGSSLLRTQLVEGLQQAARSQALPLRAEHFRALGEARYAIAHNLVMFPGGLEVLIDAVLEDPTSIGTDPFRGKYDLSEFGIGARVHERWSAWTPEQRIAAANGLLPWIGYYGTPSGLAFVRERLAAPTEDAAVKEALVVEIRKAGALTFGDLRASFDLSSPDQAAKAAPHLQAIELGTEEYAAFRDAALRSPGLFIPFLALLDTVAPDALESSDAGVRRAVLNAMSTRQDPRYLPYLKKAATDSSPSVRATVATALGSVYDKEGIVALTRLLDDPTPFVRDAALASLTKIKEIESQKAYWKDFAEKMK